jgi:mannitol-1-phosphate/altronate dehydrogenase
MNWNHVHFGAGRFGLGMVVESCQRAGFKTMVLNRRSEKSYYSVLEKRRSYDVVFEEGPARSVAIDIYFYEDTDSRPSDLIADPSVLLLTTSVTPDGLERVAYHIAEGIEKRRLSSGAPNLCVIACENLTGNSETLCEEVKRRLSPATVLYFSNKVFFCNTVIDRICSDISMVGNNVQITTEQFADWVIHSPVPISEAISLLAKLPIVTVARSSVELSAYEVRKYWLLNALHLAAAAYAYISDRGLDLLAEALKDSEIRRKVTALQEELALAFRCYAIEAGVPDAFTEESLAEYNSRIMHRFSANRKERVARLLKHVTAPDAIIDRFISSTLENLKADTIADAMRINLRPVLEIFDLHQFLDRVAERIIEPQTQLLRYPQVSGRLQLDSALQSVVTAMQRYVKSLHQQIYRDLLSVN